MGANVLERLTPKELQIVALVTEGAKNKDIATQLGTKEQVVKNYLRSIYDKTGRMDNPGFLDYRVPVASDLPMIEPILVEVPNPAHPYGAKGVGEVNIVPPMAAIANAIESAIHRRLTELPMSPPKIRAALDQGQADD